MFALMHQGTSPEPITTSPHLAELTATLAWLQWTLLGGVVVCSLCAAAQMIVGARDRSAGVGDPCVCSQAARPETERALRAVRVAVGRALTVAEARLYLWGTTAHVLGRASLAGWVVVAVLAGVGLLGVPVPPSVPLAALVAMVFLMSAAAVAGGRARRVTDDVAHRRRELALVEADYDQAHQRMLADSDPVTASERAIA